MGLVPVVDSQRLRSSICSSSTFILLDASSREPREEERRHWVEERGIGKRRASEARRGRVMRSNFKLPKFKDDFSRNHFLSVKQRRFCENRLCFILFKDGFMKIVFEMLPIFTKMSPPPNRDGFVTTEFKCASWDTLFLVVIIL